MTQSRKNIRESVVTILKSAETTAGERVYGNRSRTVWKTELPAILVFSREEESKPYVMGEKPLKRALQLVIQAEVEGTGEIIDDTLDELADQMEDAMKADPTLGDLSTDSTLLQTQIEVSSEGERPYGAIRLTYEVTYIK